MQSYKKMVLPKLYITKVQAISIILKYSLKMLVGGQSNLMTISILEPFKVKVQNGNAIHLADGCCTRITDTESFGSLTSEESFSRSGSVQTNVSNNDVVFRQECFGHYLWWIQNNLSTAKALCVKQTMPHVMHMSITSIVCLVHIKLTTGFK